MTAQIVELDSREKIIKAAITVFAEKGKYGARMEEIAAKAEINKAMVYYYYSSKENLYDEALRNVVSTNLSKIFRMIEQAINASVDPVETLQKIIAIEFEVFSSEKTYTKLMLDAIANEPQEIEQLFRSTKQHLQLNIPMKFVDFLEEGMQKHIFRKVDPKQLLINIMSMIIIYFFGKPVIKVMLDLPLEDELSFLQERQAAIIDLLLFGIVENHPKIS